MRPDRDIDALRERLKMLEADGHPVDPTRFDLGHEAADRHLGGLAAHALHEVHAATTPDATAALGFALGLARRAAPDKALVWGVQAMAGLETGHIHGPGLRELGLDPGRVVLVRVREMKDLLAAGEEALACGAVGTVLLTAWGEAKAMSLTASRRLSLAAAQGRATAILVRLAAQPQPSAAESRWRVKAALSRALEAEAPGHPTYAVELLRHRLGAQPNAWIMEWDRERGVFEQGGRNAGHQQPQRPTLPGDLVSVPADRSAEAAVVLVEKVKGALRLAAVDPRALGLGLAPGMTLADARARAPDIRVVVYRPEADAALLKRVLLDFGRFTPMAATDGGDGLALDVTGCAHLFGGEVQLVKAVEARARGIGLAVRTAMAGAPEAARALTRFGRGGIHEGEGQRAALRRLPVAALELSDKETQALSRAGLKTLAHLDDRPTAPIAARFGAGAATRLNRVLGREDVRIRPERPILIVSVDRVLVEPITETTDIEAVIGDLLAEAMDRLDLRGQGGRAFQAAFFRVDGEVRRITVRTGRPSRDAAGVLRLFRERLAALARPLDPGFGFDQLRLSVPVADRLASRQRGFERTPPGAEDLGRLVDRLTARLGPEAVSRFEPVESHRPECAVRLTPAALPSSSGAVWPEPDPADPPLRPLQMFDPPQPVLATAEVPDHPPNRFIWRRVDHRLVRVEGPERIAPEWWRRLETPLEPTRDYYRVEDQEGRRFWLFRSGFYGEDPAPRWFVHGVFA